MAHTVCSTCSFLVVYLKFCTACCESVYMLIKGTCRGLLLSERAYNRNILFVCFVFVYRWGWPFKGGGGGAYNQHFKVLNQGLGLFFQYLSRSESSKSRPRQRRKRQRVEVSHICEQIILFVLSVNNTPHYYYSTCSSNSTCKMLSKNQLDLHLKQRH